MELLKRIQGFATESPDRPALVDQNGERTTTYGQLWELMGKVAAKLQSMGLRKGEAVLICMSRRMEYVATELGVIRAGGTAVPVIPEYPEERIAYIRGNCGAEHILTEDFLTDLDSFGEPEPVELASTDRVMVIYTSGSTGRPKGIVFTAEVIDNPIVNNHSVSKLVKEVRFAAMAPLSFVATLAEYFNTFAAGGCPHMIPEEARADIRKLEDYYAKHHITVAFMPPRVLAIFQSKSDELEILNTGSERLSGIGPQGSYKLVNNYAQTETCGTVCSFFVDKPYDATPIGKPKPGVTIRLLDEEGNEVPDGESGEICAEGCFPREYLNLPEETAKTFTVLENGMVRVHTGDIGYKMEDGNYVYLNRKDWMVKINGQRVDPGEIENAIKSCPGVKNGAVRDFTAPSGQIYLCGYFVGDVAEEDLRKFLTERLAPYMVPTYLLPLDAIPTNVNGKLDRSKLLPPDMSRFKEEYVAPENELQARLCAAMEEILRCGKVGIDDNFFLLGGDSIKVMQLQNTMNEPALTTEVVFQNKTPRAIASAMGQAGPDLLGEALKEDRESWPLTPSQMGVYFACVQNPEGTMYNNPVKLTFDKSRFDVERLQKAVAGAIGNHAVSRMTIDASSGQPMMSLTGGDVAVPVEKVSEEELQEKLKAFVKPFPITGSLLYRAAIFVTDSACTLAMDFHHLIFDGTSLGVMLGEIAKAYAGEALPAEMASQLVLGAWEEKLEDSDAAREAKEYFDQTLSALEDPATPAEDFPEDPALENKPSALVHRHLEGTLSSQRVERSCATLGVTPNVLFLGAFQYTLAKFSSQDQVLVCAANHGRHDARLQNTVGMLVRTVPLFAQLGKEAEEGRVGDFLAQVQQTQRDVVAHDSYPFVKLSADFGLNADIMFAFQSDAFNALKMEGEVIPVQQIGVNSALSKLEIMVFKAADGGYDLNLTYRTDLYRAETAESLLEMYATVLEGFLEREKLSEVPLCSEGQMSVMDGFNNNEVPYDTGATVVSLFRAQAKKTPQAPAVNFKDKVLTYAELDKITDALAGYVAAQGIGREDVVSVIIPRSEYMPIASLGILKAGAGYQPLDPSYPPERLNFMVQDAHAKLLIADEELVGILSEYTGPVLLTKDIPDLPACASLPEGPKPENLFIMLYTSGSTGTPKGVMLEEGNLVCFCAWYQKYFDLEAKSRVAAYASYGFDACMMDMWPALTCGACVYIIPEEIRLDLMTMGEFFTKHQITHSFMTTQVGRMFATTVENHTLKCLSSGGETLAPLSPEELPKDYTFYNGYGPTECTIFVTAHPVDGAPGRIPIGKALDNLKFYISDPQGRRLPVGAVGELCVAGHQVGRGYLNRPELTTFCPNPWSNQPGYGRLYHTGDLVRMLPDGCVDFIGRRDGQVKVRGFRIELTEVEAVIRDFPGVSNAAVVAFDAPGGGKAIAAYVVCEGKLDVDALNAFIADKKPPYMVPAATVQLDKIPLNVNGKVDKRKLPAPEVRDEETEEASSHPMTVLEGQLHDMVAKLIGREDFGVTGDLLRLGLTSLSVIKLAVELKKTYGYEADVKELMAGCSILSLENKLQTWLLDGRLTGGGSAAPEAAPEKAEHREGYPLTAAQFGVYAECMRSPDTTAYNIPAALDFPADTDPEQLAGAVQTILLSHPYIFTHLSMEGTDVEQVWVEDPECSIPVVSATEKEYLAIKAGYVQPFHLMKGPLFRITVVKTEAFVHLLCDFHHIVFDGGSMDIFLGQLKTVMEGGTLEKEEYSAFDQSLREAQAKGGEEYQDAEGYFTDMLKDCESPSEITADLSTGEVGKLAEVYVPIDLDAAEAFCRAHSFTPAHLYLAATLYTVSRFAGTRGAYLSTISNGRRDLKTAGCFGMFVRTLPVGCEVEDVSALAFVEKARDVFTGAIDHELYPYAEVCRKFSYAPNVVYEYQMGVMGALSVNGKAVGGSAITEGEIKFPVDIHVEAREGKPAVVVQYDDSLYTKAYMETLAKCIVIAADGILAQPDGRIRKLSILDDEQVALMDGFNATDVPIDPITCNRLFEAQVKADPDKTAVIDCETSLTYRQLNEAANRVAHALISAGVKPDMPVGVMMPRRVAAYAAREGALKAGGAFMPLAPDYPDGRIENIYEISGSKHVVTTKALAAERSELFQSLGITVIAVEDTAGQPVTDPDSGVKPENLAYCIFTSGSTGKPKGVMLEHHSLVNFVNYNKYNQQAQEYCENMSVSLALAAFTFDVSVLEETMPLYHGATVAIASEEEIHDPMLLAEMLLRNKVDMMKCTPSYMISMLDLPRVQEALANMKAIDIGAEPFPPSLYQKMRQAGVTAKIYNGYGPTECTISSSVDYLESDAITIGKPLSNTKLFIADLDDNVLPVGATGELMICGDLVGRGYMGAPELTREKFITFQGLPGYRSGDFARWTRNGKIECFGRKDNQVKIHGLRIELDEIENAINTHPNVKRSVVVVRESKTGDKYLCGFYTSNGDLEPEELTAHIKKTLAGYMVPPVLMHLDAMPVNANGKVDRKALPQAEYTVNRTVIEPRNDTERQLCDIFKEVLGLDVVSVDDSFFDMGGSSLSVTRVVIAAGKEGFNISYGDVFDHPTPEALAEFLTGGTAKDEFADLGGYDYAAIDALLKNNTLDSFRAGEQRPLGTVLLTGAAGFLGIHILYELLHSYDGKVYCLLRGKGSRTAKTRLSGMFHYYFEEVLDEAFPGRVETVEGDVTKPESLEALKGKGIDTVVNCAAVVKHFSAGTEIEDVNYGGTVNLLDFAKAEGCRMIQVSTMSVGGMYVGKPGPVSHLTEGQLYVGQRQNSKYTQSKYLAERAVLQAAAEGLSAKVMRVGNLAPRERDGEYQINFATNNFMRRLKSVWMVGKYPYAAVEAPFELSPIDKVAQAILILAQTPDANVVFHPYNDHTLMMGDLYTRMDDLGLSAKAVEEGEYMAALDEAQQDPEKASVLSGFIAYQNMGHGQQVFPVGESNQLTMQVLFRMGFRWPVTSERYMDRFLTVLRGLGFFD